MMHELALFAGVGGGLLATKHLLGWRTVCYVEINKYCVDALKARIQDGLLDDAPIWDDAGTFNGRPWRGCVDIVTAGFPCQPFSVAGKQKGADDERNMWPDTIRIVREVRPRWILLENVPGLRCNRRSKDNTSPPQASYYGRILGDLAESGYDAKWKVLSAAELGAPHKRDRVWIVAHSQSRPQLPATQGSTKRGEGTWVELGRGGCRQLEPNTTTDVAYPNDAGLAEWEGERGNTQQKQSPSLRADRQNGEWWATEPAVGRVAHGVAHRVDRLKAIGNGQVCSVVAAVWELLAEEQWNGG